VKGRSALLGLAFALFALSPVFAGEPVLRVAIGGSQRSFTRSQLLASPEAVEIDVARDVTYGRAMHYRAVPLDRLFSGLDLPRDQVIEVVATDGFIAILPVDLVLHPAAGGARAYLAVEPAAPAWPALPGKSFSAGPFYVVWLKPEASGVRSEQWPYQAAAIRGGDSPAKRWPQLAVDASLSADSPIRAGQALFVTQCMTCHRLNGAGSADRGPDLNLPQNPTEYFQRDALRRYIRNPASLRRWAAMQMKGFDAGVLSDREIDLIVAYLGHMAGRKTAP
jgi:mono/diheme cytochrome c family protein